MILVKEVKKMKWEVYSKLTKKQKDEYDFRFKDKNITFNSTYIFLLMIIFVSIICVNMAFFYLIITDNRFAEFRPTIQKVLIGTTELTKVGLIVIVIEAIWNLGCLIYFGVNKYNWLKKNNIKWHFFGRKDDNL